MRPPRCSTSPAGQTNECAARGRRAIDANQVDAIQVDRVFQSGPPRNRRGGRDLGSNRSGLDCANRLRLCCGRRGDVVGLRCRRFLWGSVFLASPRVQSARTETRCTGNDNSLGGWRFVTLGYLLFGLGAGFGSDASQFLKRATAKSGAFVQLKEVLRTPPWATFRQKIDGIFCRLGFFA